MVMREALLMSLHEYRVLFVAVTGVLVLLVASPALGKLLVRPRTEFFTEFWILDSNRRADDYPFNITRANNYSLFLGIGNRLGHFAYYLVQVKLRNQTESAPNSFNRASSSLPSIFNITAFVADNGIWEMPLTFSLDYEYDELLAHTTIYSITLNNVNFDIRGHTIAWDSNRTGFFARLFFELWIYDAATRDFLYHERSVGLWLNLTGP
jgi:uncharacterized membrane protein